MAFTKKDFQALEKINGFLKELNVPCFGLDGRYPNVKVLKAYTSLTLETCIDGKAFPCQKDYCLERRNHNNDQCCVAQELVKTIGDILQRGNATYSIGRQEPCPLAETSRDQMYIIFIVAISGCLMIILCLSCWHAVKTKKELKKANDKITELKASPLQSSKPISLAEDSESGINVSQFSLMANNNGLSTSRGSLNKKKIHGNPEEHEPCIQSEGQHKIYMHK